MGLLYPITLILPGTVGFFTKDAIQVLGRLGGRRFQYLEEFIDAGLLSAKISTHIRGNPAVIKHFDHVTVCVRDLDAAKHFFGLLGFEEDKKVVIAGEPFATYMGVAGIEADHLTMVVPDLVPRLEVQLLHFRNPEAQADPVIERLDKLGFNHICFAVDDAEATVNHVKAHGVQVRSELKGFHNRRLFFLTGPEGITVELAQWE